MYRPLIAFRVARTGSRPSFRKQSYVNVEKDDGVSLPKNIELTLSPNKLIQHPLPEPVGTGARGMANAALGSSCCPNPLNISWARPSPETMTTASKSKAISFAISVACLRCVVTAGDMNESGFFPPFSRLTDKLRPWCICRSRELASQCD